MRRRHFVVLQRGRASAAVLSSLLMREKAADAKEATQIKPQGKLISGPTWASVMHGQARTVST